MAEKQVPVNGAVSKLKSAGERAADEVAAHVRSRSALLVVVSGEEFRPERQIVTALARAEYPVLFWDIATGLTDEAGRPWDASSWKVVSNGADGKPPKPTCKSPEQVLDVIRDVAKRCVYVLRDMAPFFGNPVILRAVRSLARSLPGTPRDQARAIVLFQSGKAVHPDLQDAAVVVEWGLPDRGEIAGVFDAAVKNYPDMQVTPAVREAAIDAAVGLSSQQAQRCYASSIVLHGKRIVPQSIAAEKRRVVSRTAGLEWTEPDPRGLDAVGGLECLKADLRMKRGAFTERARAFGLPVPKGLLVVGIPGTGKSLTAQAVAAAWQMPLLRLDIGGMKSGVVGSSERNVREALKVIETVGNCVLWVDEIEKSLAGATQALDAGVSADILGQLLTWMNDRKGGAYVVATANDVRALPPELLRKGRFDEVWAVDLPTRKEREAILAVTLKKHGRDAGTIDVPRVALACAEFTGAEIASIVPEGLYRAFAEGERALTAADLLAAASTVVPLARTSSEQVQALRDWARKRARPASLPEVEEAPTARSEDGGLDLDVNTNAN